MINHVRALCLLALVQLVALGADHRATSADLTTLVFTSLYSDNDDERLAQQLSKLQLTEQLSPHIISYFQRAGAGPDALAVLRDLQHKSQSLPPPSAPVLTIQPLPSPDEQNQMLQRVMAYARGYVYSLPDFLCDQVTQRYTNLRRTGPDGNPQYREGLRHSDNFTRVLRFGDGTEESQITKVNNKPAKGLVTKRGQSISSGEFGGDMVIIFGPRAEAQLTWDHWEMFRAKRTAVFGYFVKPGKSEFSLYYCCFQAPGIGEMQQTYKSAIRGLVYLDPNTGQISRLLIRAVGLPEAFHVKESNTIIDYGSVHIGGRNYNLPLSAQMFMHAERQRNRNELRFLNYRKFEAESVFTYTESRVSYGSKK